ncbi:MAG: hypothetical protein NTY98_00800 [Verrucomicrobia bacterium]|nr:hypothetical protein [Verrucomicrobiota bacterium]
MNKLGLIVLLLMVVAGIQAADSKVVAKKQTVYAVHSDLINRTYVCAEGVEAGEIKDGIVHASLLRGDSRYLLIAYSYLSRPNHPNGRCGGGVESYLVWLRVRGSTLVAAQSVQFESCWSDIDCDISEGRPSWHGSLFTVEYAQFHHNRDAQTSTFTNHRASFDSTTPHKGIQVTDVKTGTLKDCDADRTEEQ